MTVDGRCRRSGNSRVQVTNRAEQTTVCSAFLIWSIMRTTNDVFLNNINPVCSRCELIATAHSESR